PAESGGSGAAEHDPQCAAADPVRVALKAHDLIRACVLAEGGCDQLGRVAAIPEGGQLGQGKAHRVRLIDGDGDLTHRQMHRVAHDERARDERKGSNVGTAHQLRRAPAATAYPGLDAAAGREGPASAYRRGLSACVDAAIRQIQRSHDALHTAGSSARPGATTPGQAPPGPGTFRGSGAGDQYPVTDFAIGPGDPGQPRRLLLCLNCSAVSCGQPKNEVRDRCDLAVSDGQVSDEPGRTAGRPEAGWPGKSGRGWSG